MKECRQDLRVKNLETSNSSLSDGDISGAILFFFLLYLRPAWVVTEYIHQKPFDLIRRRWWQSLETKMKRKNLSLEYCFCRSLCLLPPACDLFAFPDVRHERMSRECLAVRYIYTRISIRGVKGKEFCGAKMKVRDGLERLFRSSVRAYLKTDTVDGVWEAGKKRYK